MVDLSPYTGTTQSARMVWLILFLIGVAYELITLPTGHRDTLSHAIWDTIRWSNWRFVFLPAWCWLSWHWVFRPQETVDYRDLIALGIGVVWALVETILSRRS